jgi:hypothetical protein
LHNSELDILYGFDYGLRFGFISLLVPAVLGPILDRRPIQLKIVGSISCLTALYFQACDPNQFRKIVRVTVIYL